MSEKGSPFINFLSHLIFGSAEDNHVEEEVVQGLVSAHQMHDASGKHHPFAVMKPKVRDIVEDEVDGADTAVEKLKLRNIGYVPFKDKKSGPAVQSLAEGVDRHVSEKKTKAALETRTVENGKRMANEIVAGIADREGWEW